MLGEATGLRRVYPQNLVVGGDRQEGRVDREGGGGERRLGRLTQNGHSFLQFFISDVYFCIVAPFFLLFLVVWYAA